MKMDFAQIWGEIGVGYGLFLAKASFWLGCEVETLHWGLMIGGGYLLFLLLFFPLRKGVKKAKIGLEKSLVTQIDEMIFLLAKYQYQNSDLKSIGGNPHIALMRSIFAEGKSDYIKSSQLILENMHKVEQVLAQRVISDEREMTFHADLKKFRMMKGLELVLRGIVGIGTIGIGLLFG